MQRRQLLRLLCLPLLTACGQQTTSHGLPRETETSLSQTPRPAALFLTPPPTPEPMQFPRDFGSHDVLTEWWYYTGHLQGEDGAPFGFEFVIFQVQRFGYPTGYAAHAAITAVKEARFYWDDRLITLPRRQQSWPLQLRVADWSLTTNGEQHELRATSSRFSLALRLQSLRAPLLHDGDGYFEWAPGTGSFYYSQTRLSVKGTVDLPEGTRSVEGLAWHDHQWGNFLLGAGGWDWFAFQMNDGSDLMLWQSRDPEQTAVLRQGTLLDADGQVIYLAHSDITITPLDWWRSPHSGATYPSSWLIELPSWQISLQVLPLLPDQELQAVRSTGVIYWEGAVSIQGMRAQRPLRGQGYVELTGYAPTALQNAGPSQ